MARTLRYLATADKIGARLASGDFAAGELLPTEAALAGQHRVSRVTVRKALAHLKRRGLVDSRQGFGWYAVGPPLRQTLENLQTIEAQIEAEGRRSERRILAFAFVSPAPEVASRLDAPSVLEISRLNLIDGRAFARITVWVPEALGAHLSRKAVEERPLYELLGVPLGGATQVIGATAATAADARALGLPEGSPLLRCERTTRDTSGRPVLFSESVFNPLITEFVADLPATAGADAEGLRLVR